MSHTQGKLRFSVNTGPTMQSYSQPVAISGTGDNVMQLIAGCFGDVVGGEEQAQANARRLVAAWNWCDGLPTETLETSVSTGRNAEAFINNALSKEFKLEAERDALRAVNAELVEALKGLDEAYCRAGTQLKRDERHQDRVRLILARAALAKAAQARTEMPK